MKQNGWYIKAKEENGRSMMEILAVLAIIGILSVGGWKGFGYAARRHRITQSIQQVNLAMQSARALSLHKASDLIEEDPENNRSCLPIRYIMTGVELCNALSFRTSIGACVSVCQDEQQVWYMDIAFDPNREDIREIISQDDCRNILYSEISREGFLNNDGQVVPHRQAEELEVVCEAFIPLDEAEEGEETEE